MANRQFQQFNYSMEKGLVRLYARVNIGATGAPTLVTTTTNSGNPSNGILSVTRASAGRYVFTFGGSGSLDTYQRLVYANVNVLNSTISGAVSTQIAVEAVTTVTAPAVTVQCLAAAGTAVDPNNGDVLLAEFVLKNSTV